MAHGILLRQQHSGEWRGRDGQLAAYQDGARSFFQPAEGWLAWSSAEDLVLVFNGSQWVPAAPQTSLNPVPLVGINATADGTNRLVVSSPSTLFNHDGGRHLVKINKSAPAQTASILVQTGFSGRAEFGTTGDDNFRIKVSATGATWTEAMVVASTGIGGIGNAAPGARLHVTGSTTLDGSVVVGNAAAASNYLNLRSGAAGYKLLAFSRQGAERKRIQYQNSNDSLQLVVNNTERARISSDGSLGIGVATPAYWLTVQGTVAPAVDNASSLGALTARWSTIFAATGVIQTSDERDKTDITEVPGNTAVAIVDGLAPITYRWIEGAREVTGAAKDTGAPLWRAVPGKRRHAGFRAQDVKAVLERERLDVATWGLEDASDRSSRQWLRPDELLPILWAALRQTRVEIADLAHTRPKARD